MVSYAELRRASAHGQNELLKYAITHRNQVRLNKIAKRQALKAEDSLYFREERFANRKPTVRSFIEFEDGESELGTYI